MFRSAAMMQRAAVGARTKHVQHTRKDSSDEGGFPPVKIPQQNAVKRFLIVIFFLEKCKISL